MPNVPSADAPTVMPSAAPVQVSTPPSAFGASVVGGGLEDLGKTLGVGSDMLAKHAEIQANLDASAASNSAAVASSQKQDDLALQFRNENPGMKAQAALSNLYADLDKARLEARGELQSPLAQKMFDAQTRLQQEKLQISNSTWASGEVKQSRVASWKSFLDNQSRGTTLDTIDQQAATIEPTLRSWAAQEGWSEDQVTAARSAWIGNTAYALANGVAGKNPTQASATLEKYGEFMNPQERGVLLNQIQASTDAHMVAGVADQAFAHSLSGTQPGGQPPIARFATPEAGLAAADQNLRAKVNQHDLTTLNAIIGDPTWGWAPAADHNNPVAYAQTVASQLGISPTANISQRIAGDPAFRQQVLTAMAGVEKGQNNNPLNLRSHGWQGEVGATPQQQLDQAEMAAPAALQTIASNPALRGDPILINNAQRQYLTNLSQARQVQNVATKGAFDRLYTSMIDGNIQDVGKLQSAYPQASQDWASLPEESKQQLQRQAGSAANMWTPGRDAAWQQLQGQAINNPAAFASQDLTKFDLTRGNRDKLYEEQQKIIANKATQQANVTSALQLEPVKQALATRSDLKPDSPGYDQFTGAFAERMQEFMDNHNGKIGAEDKARIAVGLLGQAPAHNYLGPIQLGATTVPAFSVSPDDASAIRAQVEPNIKRKLTDYEVGQIYARTHNSGR